MTIHVHCGKPGGGKSYHSVQSVKAAVETGRHVVTNLPLKADHPFWQEAQQKGLLTLFPATTLDMGATGRHLGSLEGWAQVLNDSAKSLTRAVSLKGGGTSDLGPLIVVDECGSTFEYLQGGDKRSQTGKDWARLLEFFRLHRHSKCDIVLVVQEYMQLAPGIRGLVDRWHEIVNTQEVWGGGHPYIIRTYLKGPSIGSSRPFEKRRGAFTKDGFELYDSFAMGAAQGTGEIKGVKGLFRARPWWMRWPVLIMAAAALLMVPATMGLMSSVGSFMSGEGEPVTLAASTPTQASQQVPLPSPARPLVPPAGPVRALGEKVPQRFDFVGFDGQALLYADGTRIERRELPFSGLELKSVTACRVVLIDRRVDPFQEIVHVCARGN